MKKIILVFILLVLLVLPAYARSDPDRMISSGLKTASAVISESTTVKIYGLTIIATAANGTGAILDTASTDKTVLANAKVSAELNEATQYGSETIQFPKGLNVSNGIYLYLNNAKAIVYYH